MRTKSNLMLAIVFLLALQMTAYTCKQIEKKETPVAEASAVEPAGIINAKPEQLASNISLDSVLAIGEYLARPENKVKIQFPSGATQYAWQHMSKFLPTAQVLRGTNTVNIPYAINPKIGEMAYRNTSNASVTVNEHFEKFPIDAMLVIKNGKIVYERYKTMAPQDKHIWFSVSKVIGPTLLLNLEKEGKVDINKYVSNYLPELQSTVWDSVKVVEALNMATGLNGTEHDEPNSDSRTNPEQIWFKWASSIGLLPVSGNENTPWYKILGAMKRVKPAFTAFEYNSINTFVVNRIVERAANKPLADLFSEKIWSQLGMEHDGFMVVSPKGMSLGFFGMNSTLRDMGKFGMLFTPSCSVLNKDEVLNVDLIKKLQKGSHPEIFSKGHVGQKLQESFPDETGLTNNYQWDAVFTDGDLFKSGVGGQGLYVSPAKNTVIVWFCTGTGNNREETMARAIVKSLP